MRRRVALVVALLVCMALVAPVAQGYIGQAPVQILMSGPSGPARCGTTVTISATVLGAGDGKPIAEQVVEWGLSGSGSRADRLDDTESSTDETGTARVDLVLGPDPGTRRVKASVTIVDASVQVKCVRRLPQTSLERPGDPTDPYVTDAHAADTLTAPAPGSGKLALRIGIPRLGISAPIEEGDGLDAPSTAVAHYPGSAWPGAGSNVYLYGHARAGLFHELWRVQMHDLVEVTLASGAVARYRVSRIIPLARADDFSYLDATDGEQLTLQTCLWYDEDSPRFIVIALPLPASL